MNIIEVIQNPLNAQAYPGVPLGGGITVNNTINQAGVLSLNNLTGNITFTGVGDAEVSVNNNEISIFVNGAQAQTSGFITTGNADLRYYQNSNPSGYITNSGFALISYVVDISGELNNQISNIQINDLVYQTGNQNISGIKTFSTGIVVTYISGGQNYSGGLIDSAGISSIDWNNRQLKNINGTVSIDYSSHNLNDTNGNNTVLWNSRVLVGVGGTYPLEWNNRLLRDSSDTISVNWDERFLSGDWAKNGNKILTSVESGLFYQKSNPNQFCNSGNLYETGSLLNNKINSLSGVSVLTNGNQTINGNKTFNTGITISGDGVDFVNSSNPIWKEGRVFYDNDEKALSYYNDVNDVTVNLGQELLIRVVNKFGSQINNGQVVYISGAQGNRPKIYPAIASDISADRIIGVATHDIQDNHNGYVTTNGIVHDLDLSSFLEGDTVYLSSNISGGFINTPPNPPDHIIKVGTVLNNSSTEGTLFVDINHDSSKLEYAHDVYVSNIQNNDLLIYNQNSGKWVNQPNFSGILQSGINNINNNTGNFYLNSNPYQYIRSGDVSSTYSTISDLQLTGSALDNKINTVSGIATGKNDRIIWENLTGLNPNIIFEDTEKAYTLSLIGNTTFTGSGYSQGRSVTIFMTSDSSLRTLAFPLWTWIEGTPESIDANKSMIISLICTGDVYNSVFATYGVQL